MNDGADKVEQRPPRAESLRCTQCDYDLRGLDPAGKCPECGTDIAHSVAASTLQHADPRWLQTVAQGLACTVVASVISLLLRVDPLVRWLYEDAGFTLPHWGIHIFSTALFAVAVWWTTAPEPRVRRPLRRERLRLATRWLGIGCDGLIIVDDVIVMPLVARFLLVSLVLVVNVLWWLYLRRLLLRVPRPGLALGALVAMIGDAVSMTFTDWTWTVIWLFEVPGRFAELMTPAPARYAQWAFWTYGIVLCLQTRAILMKLARPHHNGDGGPTENPAGGGTSHATGLPDRG